MKNQGTAKLLSLLLVTQFAFMPITKAADSDATQAALLAAVLAPPKCEDWSKAVSFEEATQEYMRQALITPRDFSCVSRASWMAVEDLFRPENSSIYLSRLKDFDKTYTSKTYKTEAAQKAVEDIKILFQLRWLSNNYEAMKDYRSSKVVKSVVVGTVAAGVIVGAGFLLHIHSQALYEVEAALWPAAIRMLGYIGTMLFTRVATNESTGEGSGKLKMTKPPLDIIGGRGEMLWSYGDLHLMRDMTALTANAVASGGVHAAVVAFSIRFLGGCVGLLSAGSIVGFAVAYPIGQGVEWAVDKAITDKYHKLHADRTLRMTDEMKSANRTDWGLNVLVIWRPTSAA